MSEIRLLESPSSQKKFDSCRLLGQLQYIDRWEPREAERSLPARLRGTAFSRASELVHKAIMDGEIEMLSDTTFIHAIIDEAVNLFDRQYTYCETAGIVFDPNVASISRAELRRVIPLYAHYTPVRQWKKVLGVEYKIEQYSCRIDIVGINCDGFHVAGDIKYKTSLESRYENNTIEEFHWDPQFLQYNHAFREDQKLGADVPVYSTLLLVVGTAFRIKQIDWLYTPEQLALWLASAKDLSIAIREIKDGKALPRAATVHKSNFGWCPMKKACLEYNLDPELMARDYVKLERLPD